jgi:hypothetical protein
MPPIMSSRLDTQPSYEMANFDPISTGLATRIWLSPKGHARHGPRLKVVTEDHKLLSVTLSPTPTVLAAPARYRLAAASLRKVEDYIRLNLDVLLAYWHDEIDTATLVARLQRLL